jgi:ATP-dependent helicase/nuclease subunit A
MTATALRRTGLADPTASQRAASDPTESVWVNASAGSGKTTVLTSRVTRLLLAGVAPQKILCLTYTRAGAAEMSNRVTEKFSKWASCDDDVLRDDLADLQNAPPTNKQLTEARRLFASVLACPGGLRIRTIHSFCQEILSRFPIEAGLPPHFSLIDEQEFEVLKSEVLDDLLREAAGNPEHPLAQALAVLVAAQGEHGFDKMLQDALRERGRLTKAMREAGGSEQLIADMRGLLQLEADDTPHHLRSIFMLSLPEADMWAMAAWLSEGTPSHVERGRILQGILETPAALRGEQFDDYRCLFLTQKNDPLSKISVASKEVRQRHPEIDDVASNEATRLIGALEQIEAAEIAQLTESVLLFGGAFAERLAGRKAARAALDYDDLIQFTDALLQREGIAPWILYKLDNGIDHILVDEAQDTSRAQWNIVQALTAEFYAGKGIKDDTSRTLFVVGDEKQSIFSFQNADPEAFLGLRETFAERLDAAGKILHRIPMHTSFRSAPAILEAVDAIFANDAARAGVSPDPIQHSAFKNRDGSDKIGRVEVWPLLQQAKDDTKSDGVWVISTDYEDEHDPQAELAQQIAQKIKGWLVRGEVLPGFDRPITPGDIMILLRRRGRFADLMVRALKTNDVPVTGVDRMRLVSQLPVMDLLALVRFVLLPEDDLNLATLLRGPLLGLSEDQLMGLAIGRSGTLWQSLKSSAFTDARDYLAGRLNAADFSTPFAFLSHILNAPCPANPTSGRMALWGRLGPEALDPIEELLNAAQNFGQRRSPSLQNFLHWLTQADAEIKRELDRGGGPEGGQVRIMTVHASKGLEAPIVFLPDTASVPRATDLPKFQWGLDDIPLFLARRPDFGMARRLWQSARDRQLEEYRRLYYVALTRAANRLYICGWQGAKSDSDTSSSWYNLAASALRPMHREYLVETHDNEPAPDIIYGDVTVRPLSVQKDAKKEKKKVALPAWALRSVKAASPTFKSPITEAPSAATPDVAFARGRIIHRLLQSLPDIAPEKRTAAMARFLSQPRYRLDNAQCEEIAGEVGKLLQDPAFSALFGPDSRAEIPLTGTIDNIKVFRQVDRLCLRGDEVWIVDYKTNRPPPLNPDDIPEAYRRQMGEYRQLLGGIYPSKKIRCFLLWTYAPRLMEVVK